MKEHSYNKERASVSYSLLTISESRAASRMMELDLLASNYFSDMRMNEGVVLFTRSNSKNPPSEKQLKKFGQSCVIACLTWILTRLFLCHATLEQAINSETQSHRNQLEEMKRFIGNQGGELDQLLSDLQSSSDEAGRAELFVDISDRSKRTMGALKVLQVPENRARLAYSILSTILTNHPMFNSSITVAAQLLSVKGWARVRSSLEGMFTSFAARGAPEFDTGIAVNTFKEFLQNKPKTANPIYTDSPLKPANFHSPEQERIVDQVEFRMKGLAEERAMIYGRVKSLLDKEDLSDSDLGLLQITSESTADLMERCRDLNNEIANNLASIPKDV